MKKENEFIDLEETIFNERDSQPNNYPHFEKQCKTFVNDIEFVSDFTFKDLFENMILLSKTNKLEIGLIRITIGNAHVQMKFNLEHQFLNTNLDNWIKSTFKHFINEFDNSHNINMKEYIRGGFDEEI